MAKTLTCAHCGREFTARNSTRKYCSSECYVQDRFYSGKPPAPHRPPQKHIPTPDEQKKSLLPEGWKPTSHVPYDFYETCKMAIITCRQCGKQYPAKYGYGWRFCSADCVAAAHPECTRDKYGNIHGRIMTKEEGQDEINFQLSLHYGRQMLLQGIISKEELIKWAFILAAKYAPQTPDLDIRGFIDKIEWEETKMLKSQD